MTMNEVGRDVGEDRFRFVGVHDGAALEMRARAAMHRQHGREEAARARLGGSDRELGAGPELDGDELARGDDTDRPERRSAADRERREYADDEDLVGERVEEGAKRCDLIPPAGESAVGEVGRRGAEEQQERAGKITERDEPDDGRERDGASDREGVWKRHCARKTRSTTSPWRPRLAMSWPL